MNEKKKNLILLILLFILLFSANYSYLDFELNKFLSQDKEIFIERVIDGDTIVSNKSSIRLLGINTPEKGEKYSLEAKQFMELMVLNKTAQLKFGKERTDLYGRTLAYAFIGNKNLNLEMISKGFANPYFPSGKDGYYSAFFEAWNKCLITNENLCKVTDNFCGKACIKLSKFEHEKQLVEIQNICPFECDLSNWTIKDEGRKKFIFENYKLKANKRIEILVGNYSNSENILYWNRNYIWTRTGDTLFLRDDKGDLVLWQNY